MLHGSMARDGQEGAERLALGEVLDFMRLLWALDHGLNTVSKRMGEELGVTGPQRLVIRMLGRFPGIAPGRLAEILHLHPSTLTGVLKRLESRGVIQRRIDPADGRRALLSLTAKGKLLDKQRQGTVEEAVHRVLERSSRARRIAAERLLMSLTQELSAQASR